MKPKVSIIIPTRNSASTLESCLKSVENQTYLDFEIIVVDSNSVDNTTTIAKKFKCKVIMTEWKLLGARYLGMEASEGDYILLLDSDQILEENTIQKSMDYFNKYDMLCLEEKSLNPKTLIEKMFNADRRLILKDSNLQLDPIYGAMLPRFFKRSVLSKAFTSIPSRFLPFVVAHDHAIIYFEAHKVSAKVTIIPNAVQHKEPSGILELWKKNFRYGRSTKKLSKEKYYNDLVKRKTRFRKSKSSLSKDKIMSSLLLLIKAPSYLIGYYL